MRATARLLLLSFVAVLAFAPSAHAAGDEAEAARSFHDGTVSYGKADYRAAAESFERAYALAPHGSPAYNAGLAWEAMKEPARAADDYQVALDTQGLTSAQAADAYSRLAALDKKLGRFDVVGPSGTTVSVAHVDHRELPRRVHLAPGTYEIRATFADGHESVHPVTAVAGASERIDVAVTTEAPPPPAPAPAASAAPPPPPSPPTTSDEGKPHPLGGRKILGLGLVGAGVVVAGVGTFLGVEALGARDDFNASGHTSQSLHDKAASLRLWTNVSFACAVALAGTGAVLFLTAHPPADAAASARAPRLTVSGTSARVTIPF